MCIHIHLYLVSPRFAGAHGEAALHLDLLLLLHGHLGLCDLKLGLETKTLSLVSRGHRSDLREGADHDAGALDRDGTRIS